jgi:hypothetical protein
MTAHVWQVIRECRMHVPPCVSLKCISWALQKDLVRIAKKLKKNNVAVDVVS